MIELFWYYLSSLTFIVALIALFCVYRYYLGNALIANANKLKSQIANIRRDYPYIGEKPQQMVENSLEGIGLDGIIDSLGLPKIVTPFVKGFLSNPDNINKIMEILKQRGINIPMGETKKEGETPLL